MIAIDELLTQQFSVAAEDIDKAKSFQQKSDGRIEKILLNMGVLSDEELPKFYHLLLGTPFLNKSIELESQKSDWHEQVKIEELVAHHWFPVSHSERGWLIATLDPLMLEPRELLTFHKVEFELAIPTEEQANALADIYVKSELDSSDAELTLNEEEKLKELASEAPTVNLLNSLMAKALKLKASDMHLEPHLDKYRVRFRIDGVLQDIEMIPAKMRLSVASRLKILSGMDIAEKRKPQDGKIEMKLAGEEFDIRVSSLPLNDGESIVMRFLRKQAINYSMEVLGLSKDIQGYIERDLKTTAGVILLTGPTGSGKTTSLYSFLNAINDAKVKIITLEDPVEYQLDGINQVQIHSEIGFDFAAGLRSIVRQDPDVIMLGEIRDSETAQIAMQSALTGHLVFSTVHTNDAASAYTRLIDLGAEEFLLNAAITSIIAQRLARKLCQHCCQDDDQAHELIEKYELKKVAEQYGVDLNIKKPYGCEFCNHTGYSGRIAIVEYLPCDEEIKKLPKDKHFQLAARELARSKGYRNLVEDGIYKAVQGITTIEEVLRVAG
ncbi:GspE/PulE family protein [Thalassotalea montiporae]